MNKKVDSLVFSHHIAGMIRFGANSYDRPEDIIVTYLTLYMYSSEITATPEIMEESLTNCNS